MKEIKYGIFCEDISQKTFLIEFLKIFEKGNDFYFSINEFFSNRYRGRTKKGVLNNFVNVTIAGFTHYSLNILFVGIDYDDKDRTKYKEEYKQLQSKLPEVTAKKTIIFYPVQAIEHWMLFIKYNVSNPKSTKNISSNIEKITRKDAKKQIYGTHRPNNKISKEKSSEISSKLSINWLKSKSESFRFFVNNLENIIE